MKRNNPKLTKEYEQIIWQVAQVMFEQQKNDKDYPFDDMSDQFGELKELYINNGVSKEFIDFAYEAIS